jgi:Peptidyl-tRNA hydrolase
MNIFKFFSKKQIESKQEVMKKFLIVGLGNIGDTYENTRHNIGFQVLDALAKDQDASFETEKLGDITRFRYKGRVFILLKPKYIYELKRKSL